MSRVGEVGDVFEDPTRSVEGKMSTFLSEPSLHRTGSDVPITRRLDPTQRLR